MSEEFVIVSYIKITLSTEIVYAGRNRRSLNATVQLCDYLTICDSLY